MVETLETLGKKLASIRERVMDLFSIITIVRESRRIGMGTTNPARSLDIQDTSPAIQLKATGTSYKFMDFADAAGNFRLGRESAAGGNLITGSASYAGIFRTNDATPVHFGTTNLIRMTILGDGNIGIGTTAPNSLLQVGAITDANQVNDIVSRAKIYGSSVQSQTEEVLLRMMRNPSTSLYYPASADFKLSAYQAGGSPYTPATKLTIALKSTANYNESADVNVMTLLDTGKVGIGTTAPNNPYGAGIGAKLAVWGGDIAVDASSRKIGNFTDAAGYRGYIVPYDSGGHFLIYAGYTDSTIKFFTGGEAAGNERMRINNVGKVGIGRTNPATLLDIQGPTSASVPNVRVSTADNGYEINEGIDAANYGWIGSTNATSFAIKTNGSIRAVVDTSGNMGIGNTNPQDVLDVTGDIRCSGKFSSGGTDGVTGSFTTVDLKTVTVTNGIITAIV